MNDYTDLAARIRQQREQSRSQMQAARHTAQANLNRLSQTQGAIDGKQKDLRVMRDFSHVRGFFPTPPRIAEKMCEYAKLQPGQTVLEPSAGKGNLVDAALKRGALVTAIENNYGLYQYLVNRYMGNGRVIAHHQDFLEQNRNHYHLFDVVLMNPPFEHLADTDHVMHAHWFLKHGGILVAVMSESAFTQQSKDARIFQTWIYNLGGIVEKLPEDTFRCSERPTGVQTRLVVVRRYDPIGEREQADRERRAAQQKTEWVEELDVAV